MSWKPVADVREALDGPQSRLLQRHLEDHWQELRSRLTRLPRWEELDARSLAAALPWVFAIDRTPSGDARLRSSGWAVSDLLGALADGRSLSDLFTPAATGVLGRWMDRCFDTPALVDIPIRAWQGPLRPTLTARLVLLPLHGRKDWASHGVGGLFLDSAGWASGVRFDLVDAPGRCEVFPATLGLAEVRSPAPTCRPARRDHLCLVVNNA
jgi:hypothetical protein